MTDSTTVWKRLRDKYLLPQDEVHVWRARLDWPSDYVARSQQTLSPDERERADRFHFPADRTRHVVGRALARILLGHCLGITASSVSFEYSARGKPSLATNLRQTSLNFNVRIQEISVSCRWRIAVTSALIPSEFARISTPTELPSGFFP